MHGQNQRQIHRPMPVRRLFYAGVRSTLGRQISFCLPVPPGRQTAGTVFDPCHRMLRRLLTDREKDAGPESRSTAEKDAPRFRCLPRLLLSEPKKLPLPCRKIIRSRVQNQSPQKRPGHSLVLTIYYRSQLLKYTIKIYAAEAPLPARQNHARPLRSAAKQALDFLCPDIRLSSLNDRPFQNQRAPAVSAAAPAPPSERK